tara:strand:+ start:459 stop:1394 length:936 start_codon:yes stop_codon:yes gene_type:complete
MIKKVLFTIFSFLFSMGLYAQQDAMFSHYMFNLQSVNPAYVGSREVLNVMTVHRSQWLGFKGSPMTQTISLNMPLFDDEIGYGLTLMNDKIGPVRTFSFNIDGSYHLKVNTAGHKLSFGIKAGGSRFRSDFSVLSLDEPIDDAFVTDIRKRFLPNFGVGFYYNTPDWYAGFSIPHMINYAFNSSQRHYFLIGGALFDLTNEIKIRPSSYIKMTQGAPVNMDLSAYAIFKDTFWVGVMTRTTFGRILPTGSKGGGVGIMAGFNVNEELTVGYSFDYSVGNSTFKYNGGSHELMLRYDFIYKKKDVVKSPRYF